LKKWGGGGGKVEQGEKKEVEVKASRACSDNTEKGKKLKTEEKKGNA